MGSWRFRRVKGAVTCHFNPSEKIRDEKCSERKSAFQASILSTFLPFFSPQFYPVSFSFSPPSLSLKKKKVIFSPNKQDGTKLCNLQMYEINIIPNEPLGKCSPLNLAKDYGGKKKS